MDNKKTQEGENEQEQAMEDNAVGDPVMEEGKETYPELGEEGADDEEEAEAPTEQEPFETDGEGQAIIPGTEDEEEEEDDNVQRAEPRHKCDIEYDFRMAVFGGQVKKVTEDWKSGRKLSVMIESDDRARLTKGLEKFTASDDLVFRILPRQPRFNDREPEEFGTKVPRFGVDMIERLEKKAFDGFEGWQEMEQVEILKRMAPLMVEIEQAMFDIDPDRAVEQEALQKQLIDLANYAFFMWWNSKVISDRNKATI